MSYKQDAEETKEWDRFWGSGKIDDYLRYKSCRKETEDRHYAGFRAGDGDGAQSNPCG